MTSKPPDAPVGPPSADERDTVPPPDELARTARVRAFPLPEDAEPLVDEPTRPASDARTTAPPTSDVVTATNRPTLRPAEALAKEMSKEDDDAVAIDDLEGWAAPREPSSD